MHFLAFLLWLPFIGSPDPLTDPRPDLEAARTEVRYVLEKLQPPGDLLFDYRQQIRRRGHLSRPWQTIDFTRAGALSLGTNLEQIHLQDSLVDYPRPYHRFRYLCDNILIETSGGSVVRRVNDTAALREITYDLAQFTPAFILKQFLALSSPASFRYVQGAADTIAFDDGDGNLVSIAVTGDHVGTISVLYDHEMYGDVVRTYTYGDYRNIPGTSRHYAAEITERELNIDNAHTIVTYRSAGDLNSLSADISVDKDLSATEKEEAGAEDIPIHQPYRGNIHLLDFKSGERSVVVEFDDFLLVSGAPLHSANGETVLREARRIAPEKPVKYFIFGHHHPSYLGGIRAFIHYGATLLMLPENEEYVRWIASNPHSLNPDALQREPRAPHIRTFEKDTVISDGTLEMRIIHIGQTSSHTEDFLIYYFPEYNLLVEDDLIWMEEGKPMAPASSRARGLYSAIREHGLDVESIVQTYPVRNPRFKTIVTFDELERSVLMEPEN